MSIEEKLRATADSIVVLFPTPWQFDESVSLAQAHVEVWQEEATFSLESTEDEAIRFAGSVELENGEIARLAVEDPLPELAELSGRSLEPYAESEVILLREHVSIWRLVVAGGIDRVHAAALTAARLASTFVETGAAGVFLPATHQLHSPRTIKRLTMQLDESSLANLFVGAWNSDDWMRTRGLTAFGLPEIETPVDEGLNAAYFRLMDVAAGMIARAAPFPPGSRLQMGPHAYSLEKGPHGPDDEEVPFAGTFGVVSLLPT